MSKQLRSPVHAAAMGPPSETCEWGDSTPGAALAEQPETKVDEVDTQVDAVDLVDTRRFEHGSFHASCRAGISDRDGYPVADQFRSLKRLKVKPKVESLKPGGWGEVKSFDERSSRTGGPLIRRFFFVAAEFRGSLSHSRNEFFRCFNAGHRLRASRTRIYFPRPPGGRSEVCEVEIPDRRHESFRRFRKIFFRRLGPRGHSMSGFFDPDRWAKIKMSVAILQKHSLPARGSEKMSRNSPGGGVGRPPGSLK